MIEYIGIKNHRHLDRSQFSKIDLKEIHLHIKINLKHLTNLNEAANSGEKAQGVNKNINTSGQIIAGPSQDLTLNGSLVREIPENFRETWV